MWDSSGWHDNHISHSSDSDSAFPLETSMLPDTSNVSIYRDLANVIRLDKNGIQPDEKRQVKRKWRMQVDERIYV